MNSWYTAYGRERERAHVVDDQYRRRSSENYASWLYDTHSSGVSMTHSAGVVFILAVAVILTVVRAVHQMIIEILTIKTTGRVIQHRSIPWVLPRKLAHEAGGCMYHDGVGRVAILAL